MRLADPRRAVTDILGQAVGAALANPLRSSLAALAIAAAVATIAVVVTGLDGVARYARVTSARTFGAISFGCREADFATDERQPVNPGHWQCAERLPFRRMIGDLRASLLGHERDSVLCFFGDHVPSMPAVYEALDFQDSRTEYLIWRRDCEVEERQDINVEDLGVLLLESAGLSSDPGFR